MRKIWFLLSRSLECRKDIDTKIWAVTPSIVGFKECHRGVTKDTPSLFDFGKSYQKMLLEKISFLNQSLTGRCYFSDYCKEVYALIFHQNGIFGWWWEAAAHGSERVSRK